jgi:hypothetical protein
MSDEDNYSVLEIGGFLVGMVALLLTPTLLTTFAQYTHIAPIYYTLGLIAICLLVLLSYFGYI